MAYNTKVAVERVNPHLVEFKDIIMRFTIGLDSIGKAKRKSDLKATPLL